MSDLIDFENPAPKPQLALPLIPAPETGSPPQPLAQPLRRSLGDNNPFDMVLKRIVDFEKNQEDPFERVAQKAMGSSAGLEPKLDLSPREESDMSIITDLDDTNLLEDGRHVHASGSCDNVAFIPNINVSPVNCSGDLSILDTSALNDSLVDIGSSLKNQGDTNFSSLIGEYRPRFASENKIISTSALSPQTTKRSLSVTERSKNSVNQDSLTSIFFEDPLNNAFRSMTTNNSSCSYLSNFDFSVNKFKIERLNSDSSVFSGLSNISAIPADPYSKISRDKLSSENSVFSSSNLSAITNNVSSSESNVFSNDTINQGFINSRLTLNSTSSTLSSKTPTKSADKSDFIKKFYEIKSRMSSSQIELHKDHEEKELVKRMKETKLIGSNSNEKFVDKENSCNELESKTGVSDIIIQEASRMAQMFEKMPLGKESNSANEDDLLCSKTQFNFEVLSDDESVDNLIDLPASPIERIKVPQKKVVEENKSENSIISPKPDIKALESEFIQKETSDKKAAATLLIELEKFIKVDNNPNAFKILNDLQKLMGVEYENNTETLQRCLQNTSFSPEDHKRSEDKVNIKENVLNNVELSESNDHIHTDNKNASSSLRDISENNQSDLDNADSGINDVNDSSDKPTDNVTDSIQKKNQSLESKANSDESSEDQKLTMNLLHALNKVVNQKSENSAMDVLLNLGAVLNMAAELRTKLKDKDSESKETEKNIPKRLNRSASFVLKSSPKKYQQNKSFEILPGRPSPLRRSVSIHPSSSPSCLDIKDKSKSHLSNIKKRFPSDPGAVKPDIRKKKSPKKEEAQASLTGKTTINPIISKFKKKPNSEVVAKKGPLKAVIPLGNMQKRASISQRISVCGNVTPPKIPDSASKSHIVSSTPNTNAASKDAKSKPTAASTPNVGSKSPRGKYRNSKPLSSVSFNSSLKANNSASKNSPKNSSKLERTMSPQKRPRKNSESTSGSPQWPRLSPRPTVVRNHSMNELKSSKSPPSSTLVRTSSERKLQRHSAIISPLRNSNVLTNKSKNNSNVLTNKSKHSSLISKLNKRASMQTDSEKENYA